MNIEDIRIDFDGKTVHINDGANEVFSMPLGGGQAAEYLACLYEKANADEYISIDPEGLGGLDAEGESMYSDNGKVKFGEYEVNPDDFRKALLSSIKKKPAAWLTLNLRRHLKKETLEELNLKVNQERLNKLISILE